MLGPAVHERLAKLVALEEAAHGLRVGAHLQVLVQSDAVERLESQEELSHFVIYNAGSFWALAPVWQVCFKIFEETRFAEKSSNSIF